MLGKLLLAYCWAVIVLASIAALLPLAAFVVIGVAASMMSGQS